MIEDIRYTKINWITAALMVALMFVLLFWFDRAWGENQDPKAVEVAQKTIQTMGGTEAWNKVGAVRFNFGVEQKDKPARPPVKHLWDRKNGRDHVEWERDGKKTVAWVNLSNKTGNAWTDGKKLEGAELQKALETAHARWINDTYWFLMPFKLLDRGVNLEHGGEKDGHEVLHLSFHNVGLTPGDQYWAFINKSSGLMERWQYLLQDGTKGDWTWKDWDAYGNVKLSKLKESADKNVVIQFDPLQVMDSADPSFFGDEFKTLD